MSERGKAERLAPQGARKTGRGQHARENLGSAEASVVREMRAGARRRRREKTDAVQALHRLAQGEGEADCRLHPVGLGEGREEEVSRSRTRAGRAFARSSPRRIALPPPPQLSRRPRPVSGTFSSDLTAPAPLVPSYIARSFPAHHQAGDQLRGVEEPDPLRGALRL